MRQRWSHCRLPTVPGCRRCHHLRYKDPLE